MWVGDIIALSLPIYTQVIWLHKGSAIFSLQIKDPWDCVRVFTSALRHFGFDRVRTEDIQNKKMRIFIVAFVQVGYFQSGRQLLNSPTRLTPAEILTRFLLA